MEIVIALQACAVVWLAMKYKEQTNMKLKEKAGDMFWDIGEKLPDIPPAAALAIAVIALVILSMR